MKKVKIKNMNNTKFETEEQQHFLHTVIINCESAIKMIQNKCGNPVKELEHVINYVKRLEKLNEKGD